MSSKYGLIYNGFLEVAEKWRKEKNNIIYFCFGLSYCFHLLFIFFIEVGGKVPCGELRGLHMASPISKLCECKPIE